MKRFYPIVLSVAVAAALAAGPVSAARSRPVSPSGPAAASGGSDLRLPDPHQELRHLSKDLKLKRDQRAGVSFILQERSREIQLLLDVESLSEEYREALATKVIEDSDAQIENLLRSKQKIKFDKELARDRETR